MEELKEKLSFDNIPTTRSIKYHLLRLRSSKICEIIYSPGNIMAKVCITMLMLQMLKATENC